MLRTADLSVEKINKLLQEADEFSKGKVLKAKSEIYVSNLFFEDSTRTKTSFDVAERKLGLNVVPFDISASSVNKGESLYDTVKTLKSLGIDLCVIRHKKEKFYDEFKDIDIAVINGGDGTGNHPSQNLLDLMTIQQEFGKFKGLKVGIVGDVKHSRVANSNAEVLRKLGAKVYFSGPEQWFDEGTIINGTYLSIDDLVKEVDVLMLLRIQHERHDSDEKLKLSSDKYHRQFGLTTEREKAMKKDAIIMHPAPINRGVEIADELVECSRSRIFKQMENGVFARMAILKTALEAKGFEFE
ncbi:MULTISPECIES: aspartate carbamoyltransferase catalytic subunit [unclassified Kaistella]|uniref:aspartate carbamoyltransferase catalytic subunit n=1 Tax=unclassified Kaistella TaxID=2762626 RepID=UPI002732EB4D|nr:MULTISPECIES: aspartate carbamoyltransferase catalytic subunit [unclassified Kaistella]MDP2454666.1 aspartate carbamoyltransferase catalytic subunit [Kaistella sp. SH11-4b]MDP2457403.1 aspartate carbamoyltransferase catalytic subunit [Kaistella sp. SH40-3]MDP2460163.1 aspartate carbamoyltransferase catalytic subunit [Kaistella sp. SH19-2b]